MLFRPEKIATGFEFLEGPVWIAPDAPLQALVGKPQGALVFSDIPASRLYWWCDGETGILREPSGQANGNALDREGRLLTCEHEHRRVTRTTPDGQVVAVATTYRGKRLNSPNDVVVRRDGGIYFSDPPYAVKPEHRELSFQGLFRMRPEDETLELLADDFEKPNGLAFSPDHGTLYVADTERGHLRAFSVGPAGELEGGSILCEAARPDGVRVDAQGNLLVAAMKGVEVFSPGGKRLASLDLEERPANLCFGDEDRRSLYVCARTSLFRVRVEIPGAEV